MKNKKATVSLFLAVILILSLQAGAFHALADDYVPEILPVPAEDSSLIDGEALAKLFDDSLREYHLDNDNQLLSIAVWYPGTDEYWFYNADEWMYGVNWYKLPVSMYLAEKVAQGEMTWDSTVEGLNLEYALSTSLELSSGNSISSMVRYLGGDGASDCAELTRVYADLPDSYFTDAYYHEKNYTARLMLEITKTLYLGGEERFPKVVENMKKSQPYDFLKRDETVRADWEIAQTHSAYWGDGAGDYMNCTGIIYTPTPILVTVMMKNIADLNVIGAVSWRIAHLGEALSLRQQEEAAELNPVSNADTFPADPGTESDSQGSDRDSLEDQIDPSQAPADDPAVGAAPAEQEEASVPADSEQAEAEPVVQQGETPASAPTMLYRILSVGFPVLLVIVAAVSVLLILREHRSRKRRRYRRR